jgi:hypothetical protein
MAHSPQRPGKTPSKLCVIGNAVQDVTVQLDLRRLLPDNPDLHKAITFQGMAPLLAKGCRVEAIRNTLPTIHFDVDIPESQSVELEGSAYYDLSSTDKYSLSVAPTTHPETPAPAKIIRVPISTIGWAGGGINVIKTIRSLATGGTIPVHYVDVGGLLNAESDAVRRAKALLVDLASTVMAQATNKRAEVGTRVVSLLRVGQAARKRAVADFTEYLSNLAFGTIDKDRGREAYYRKIVEMVASYNSDSHLELFLKEMEVDFGFYRHRHWRRIRNLVISGISGHGVHLKNKIVLRGRPWSLKGEDAVEIERRISEEIAGASVVMLNSVYDDQFFAGVQCALSALNGKPSKPALVVAMTEHIQRKMPLGSQVQMREICNQAVLLFNEKEFVACVGRGNAAANEFLQDLETGRSFRVTQLLELLRILICERLGGTGPEVYVTLGAVGSIGVSRGGDVWFMATHSATGRAIYDTTGCGDAYAGVVTVMTYIQRTDASAWNSLFGRDQRPVEEGMFLTMGLATTAAYSKATSPMGIIEGADVIDLLRNEYLAWVELGTISAARCQPHPGAIDDSEDARLRRPASARLVGYEGILATIVKP